MPFDLDQYLATSQKLDVSDIDWEDVSRHPIAVGEIKALEYMMDIEAHTLCYLRDLLNTDAGRDPEIADFLACWLYEESYHGRAIESFVRAAGVDRSPAICGARRPTWRERLESAGTAVLNSLRRDFHIVHMTWGSIQEITTLNGYLCLANRSRNPVLVQVLRRIIRDESRHFSFYYHKASEGLARSKSTQRLTEFLLRRFWGPVGYGVKAEREIDFMLQYIFGDAEGARHIRHIDQTISRLPGMAWFDLMSRRYQAAMSRAPRARGAWSRPVESALA
ncbi:MAG: hypothetical protein HY078_10020 [Elusimicrobia bacterium]|nr:hypothetical protein [Elusimicrobiota bacterium]